MGVVSSFSTVTFAYGNSFSRLGQVGFLGSTVAEALSQKHRLPYNERTTGYVHIEPSEPASSDLFCC